MVFVKNLQHKGILLPCSQGNLAQVKDLVYINMEDGMQNYNVEKFEGVTHTWDALQREVLMIILVTMVMSRKRLAPINHD